MCLRRRRLRPRGRAGREGVGQTRPPAGRASRVEACVCRGELQSTFRYVYLCTATRDTQTRTRHERCSKKEPGYNRTCQSALHPLAALHIRRSLAFTPPHRPCVDHPAFSCPAWPPAREPPARRPPPGRPQRWSRRGARPATDDGRKGRFAAGGRRLTRTWSPARGTAAAARRPHPPAELLQPHSPPSGHRGCRLQRRRRHLP